jgi:hypothetical protein
MCATLTLGTLDHPLIFPAVYAASRPSHENAFDTQACTEDGQCVLEHPFDFSPV